MHLGAEILSAYNDAHSSYWYDQAANAYDEKKEVLYAERLRCANQHEPEDGR